MVRTLAFVVVPLALVVAAVWWAAANPERILGVDGEQLGSSLARQTPEPGGGEWSATRAGAGIAGWRSTREAESLGPTG